MRTIHKYAITSPNTELQIPRGAKFLACREQHERPTLWFQVDPAAIAIPRRFEVHPTGGDIDEAHLAYMGTCFIGPLVWHVYERFQ